MLTTESPGKEPAVDEIVRMRVKICLVGDRAVGKTSLLNSLIHNTFSTEYEGTLGSRLGTVTFRDVRAGNKLVEAEVAVFDLMGERAMRDVFKDVMFWGTDGFLAVADITRPETIHSLPTWVEVVQSVAGDIPYRIVMNKVDLSPTESVSPADTAWLLERLPGIPYHLLSAKRRQAVEQVFGAIIDEAVSMRMCRTRGHTVRRILSNKILAFAARRGTLGIGKSDLLVALRDHDYNMIMQEVQDLDRLGLVALDLLGPSSFRVRITGKGQLEIDSPIARDRVIEVVA
jgi:small GTP-binding protein